MCRFMTSHEYHYNAMNIIMHVHIIMCIPDYEFDYRGRFAISCTLIIILYRQTTDQLHKVTYIHHIMVFGGKVVLQHGRPGPFLLPLFKAVFLTLGPPPTPKEGTWGGE